MRVADAKRQILISLVKTEKICFLSRPPPTLCFHFYLFFFFHFLDPFDCPPPQKKMASSAIALLLSGGFDDDAESKLSSSSFPPALRGIGGGPCSLERWLSLPSLPPRVLLVAAAGADERRVRSFLELKRPSPALRIEIIVISREEGGRELAAAAESAASSLSSPSSSSSLVVADAAAVPLGLDLARLRAAASLLSAPAVVVSASPLGKSKSSSGAEALQTTCEGLGKVSLLASGSCRGSSVARVAAFGQESKNSKSSNSDSHDGEIFDAQRVVFLPASSLESAGRHYGSVRSWLCAQGSSLRALVSASSPSSPLVASPSGGPFPHASTAAGRALAATLLSRGEGWSAALPASGAEAWLAALVASASAAAGSGDGDCGADFELEEGERERRPESSEGLSALPKHQNSSFSTTSSAYGATAPPAVAAALASAAAAAAAAASRRCGGGSSSATSTLPLSSSASPRKALSLLLPPLSPVLKTGSSGSAGGTLRFDIPRSRVHDKLDA